jgi:hypothetical protein
MELPKLIETLVVSQVGQEQIVGQLEREIQL